MILTCPECATSYHVDDGRIPAAGRTVKCTSCGNRWHTGADAPAPAAVAAEPVGSPAPEPQVEAAAPEPATKAAVAEDDLEIGGPDPAPRRRPLPPAAEPRRQALGAVIAWGAMAATVALLVIGAISFRTEIVKLWPKSSGAYAGLGLPVNSLGLVIEQVKVEPTFQGGRPVLSVTGAIRNVADHAADAPPLRIDLLNHAGKPVSAKIARPIDPRIPAGARRHFAISIVDPPSNAHDLQVAFDTAPVHHAEPASHEAEAALAPAAPAEAQPLAPGTPDALPNHG